MRCSLFTIALCVALAACGKVTLQSAAADVQGSADAAYIAGEAAGELAVNAGKLSVADFHADADKAYTALLAVRKAQAALAAAQLAGTTLDIITATNALTAAQTAFDAAVGALNAFRGS